MCYLILFKTLRNTYTYVYMHHYSVPHIIVFYYKFR